MSNYYIEYQLGRVFTSQWGKDGYELNRSGYSSPNPIGTVANIALDGFNQGPELALPVGYNESVLESVKYLSGSYGPQHISGTQGAELAYLGKQILELNEQGKFEPPLSPNSVQEVSHVVNVVSRHDPSYMDGVRLPEVN